MRMVIDMMMMTTKAKTAANTATWENKAATHRKIRCVSLFWKKICPVSKIVSIITYLGGTIVHK